MIDTIIDFFIDISTGVDEISKQLFFNDVCSGGNIYRYFIDYRSG